MKTTENIYAHRYFLTAGECDAEGRMPVTLLTARLIEVATEHANALGIGYATLIRHNLAWVLSRVSIEISSMPGINEEYAVETWIESTNRLFSERCFRLTSADGHVLADARTTWAAIDISTRRSANPGILGDIMFPADPPHCPVEPARRMAPLPDDAPAKPYTFGYTDLDFNRHVNTVRYVAIILGFWTLDWHDTHEIGRLDIAFHRECHYGERIGLRVSTDERLLSHCELTDGSVRAVSAAIAWRTRTTNENKQSTK